MLKKWFNLENLDYLLLARFIAIFLVVRQHVLPTTANLYLFGVDFSWLYFGNLGSGEYAVIFFFSLSAYLHSKNLLKDFTLGKIKEFYIKRLSRLLPLFFITNILYLVFTHRYLLSQSPANLIKIFTFQYFLEFSFNQVIWFVNIELLFVILLPFIIYVLYILKLHLDKVFSIILLLLIFTAPWLKFSIQTKEYYSYQIIFPVLAASLYDTISYFSKQFESCYKNEWVTYLLFLINFIALIFPWPGSKYQIAPILILLNLILFEAVSNTFKFVKKDWDINNALKTLGNLLNYFGTLTYSILLIHILVVIKLRPFLFQNLGLKLTNLGFEEYIWSHVFTVVIFAISVILSIFLYEFFEKPIFKFFCSKFINKSNN